MRKRLLALLSLAFLSISALFPDLDATNYFPSAGDFLEYWKTYYNDRGLHFPTSAAVSSDGAFIYVTTLYDNTVTVYNLDAVDGKLELVQIVKDGVGGVDGLSAAEDVLISPDGKHVYAVSSGVDDALVAFSRSSLSGLLTFIEVHKDGVSGVDGLGGAESVAISPDGKHLYVAAGADDAVTYFSRNSTSGALTFSATYLDSDPGIDGLNGADSVVVSPDGKHVYVASHTSDSVAIFSRNSSTGALSYLGLVEDGVGDIYDMQYPECVKISPDGDHLYVAAEISSSISIFTRNQTTGLLTYDGYIDNYVGDTDGLWGVDYLAVSPDGNQVYAAGQYQDALVILDRDILTGELTYHGMVQNDDVGVDGLDGIRGVVVSADGAQVYSVARHDNSLTAFWRDGGSGDLTFMDMQQSAIGLGGPVSVTVSPDGKNVYVTGADYGTLAWFSRNPYTGGLRHDGYFQNNFAGDGMEGARSAAVSPDGAHVYVAGHDDNAVAIWDRDVATGELSNLRAVFDGVDGVDGLQGVQFVALSPDGAHLYAASPGENALAAFSQDPVSGDLTFVAAYKDTDPGLDGLDGAYSIAFSPGGEQVYVAAYYDDSVAYFNRNPATGALTYQSVIKDSDSGVGGLDGANSIVVSPDGAHVYVASRGSDSLARFTRNQTTGALTFITAAYDGYGGVDGLDGARGVAISADGSHVYVASQVDDALAVFSRNPSTGALTFVECHKDSEPGIDGLNTADGLAVSPDSRHIYVAGYDDDSVTLFRHQVDVFLPLAFR